MSTDRPAAERELDVREIEGEPFGEIMAALEELPGDESLLLINSFEPEPLYGVLEERGFRHETATDSEVWYVKISHAA
ncbi:DUF2249 domain-containing protein [Natronomonas sp. F2-12]|jgi:uncharacterized protein (DUF2249 family)|uniref:DUF2249 domain-containing protein n=1 Tax=Natronomonas aquatica TaxID=2841590 RepID=A0A9R1D442_9EURY|nr:DUF2249 domain-containing protein [Natronomonas aquatica]MCQ4332969.1 DUF2249 domain-containing protein [Natronomonas aquatica]